MLSLSLRGNDENMSSATSRRAYPTGRKQLLSAEFKERVRRRLSELGRDHRWLVEQIGASCGMVTKMLAPSQNTSALVGKVCAALGIEPPTTEVHDEAEQRLVETFRKMSPDQRAHLLGLLGLVGRSEN